MSTGNAIMFRDKRDLIEWLERELPEGAQFLAPGILGYQARAASKRHPAPRLQVELIIPTDALTAMSPAGDVSWIAGSNPQVRALIPVLVARPGTFTLAEPLSPGHDLSHQNCD